MKTKNIMTKKLTKEECLHYNGISLNVLDTNVYYKVLKSMDKYVDSVIDNCELFEKLARAEIMLEKLMIKNVVKYKKKMKNEKI